MKTKTYFAFRIDIRDDTGDSIIEHVAGVDDLEVAEATYRAAVTRWQRALCGCVSTVTAWASRVRGSSTPYLWAASYSPRI